MAPLNVLRFSGAEVRDAAGVLVATVARRRGGTSLEVRDSAGALLGTASTGRWGMSNLWRAEDSAGQPLLELRKHTFRSGARIQLARGGDLTVEGSFWRKDFAVRAGEAVVLEARPSRGSRQLRKELVVESTGHLTLTEAVIVVQVWAELRRRDQSASVAAGVATVVVSS
jgi:uncharacterized protein YxjI